MRHPWQLFNVFCWGNGDGGDGDGTAAAAAAAGYGGVSGQGGSVGFSSGASGFGGSVGFGGTATGFGGGGNTGFGGASPGGTSVGMGPGTSNAGTGSAGFGGGVGAHGGVSTAATTGHGGAAAGGGATGGGGGTAAGGSGVRGGGTGTGTNVTHGMGISAQDVYAMMTPAQKEALNLQNQLRMFGGSPAYGPGVTPYNRGGVTNFGSGQGFGLGLGGEGNVAANESQTVQGIRAGLSNTAQNALAPHAPGPVTSQDVFNALDPAAKAVLQSKLAALYGGGIGHPALGYNTAAATAAHFGDPRAGPSAPVAAPSNVALAQRGGSNAVSMMGPGGPNAPSAYASNMAAFGAPTGFSQMMSQNIASNMGLGGQASVSTGGGMNRVGSDYSGQLMGGLHL